MKKSKYLFKSNKINQLWRGIFVLQNNELKVLKTNLEFILTSNIIYTSDFKSSCTSSRNLDFTVISIVIYISEGKIFVTTVDIDSWIVLNIVQLRFFNFCWNWIFWTHSIFYFLYYNNFCFKYLINNLFNINF